MSAKLRWSDSAQGDAPLQRVIAVPITDSAEQAAVDKLRKRNTRKPNGQKTRLNDVSLLDFRLT